MTSPSLPFVRDPRWVFDFLLAAVVTVLCVATAADSQGRDAQALSFLLTSSLLVRRSHPMLALGVATVAALGQAYYLTSPTLSIVVVPMIVYAVARYGKPSGGTAALWAGLAGAVIGAARWTGIGAAAAPAFAVTATACAAIVAGAYLLGRRLRERLEADEQQSRAASERRRLQESEQEQRARAVATDERSRIARELHDIVAHSLSVIVVQAEGGRAVVLKRPEVGAQVLDTIAETGRASLAEMRRIVDLLRGGETDPSYLPSPGVEDIAELVARSGERFELTTFGAAPPVSPALGLTAYRVVQESLTNVIKHAGPLAAARVTVAYTSQTIEIEVTDDGRGAAAGGSADGSPTLGHGLRGMGERVALLHGTLDARPRPGGGFTVRASLPLTSDDAAARSAPGSGE
jgi:signal transduction histidine kinase